MSEVVEEVVETAGEEAFSVISVSPKYVVSGVIVGAVVVGTIVLLKKRRNWFQKTAEGLQEVDETVKPKFTVNEELLAEEV